MDKRTIVFIHGLWLHASSWQPWMQFFNEQGYITLNPPWPGDADTVEACRSNAAAIANRGVAEVAAAYANVVKTLPEPPIVIGHSFGGLLAQIILGRRLAVAGVAINPAPMKGVWQLPLSVLRATFPVLGNPLNVNKAKSLTYAQFRYAFANAVPEQEARQLYDKWTIPAPCKPLFQAATATFAGSETKVNTTNAQRGPLLITGGDKDNTAPPVFGKESAKKYPASRSTEFKLFTNRGHSIPIDSGWKEVAEYSLAWLKQQGF